MTNYDIILNFSGKRTSIREILDLNDIEDVTLDFEISKDLGEHKVRLYLTDTTLKYIKEFKSIIFNLKDMESNGKTTTLTFLENDTIHFEGVVAPDFSHSLQQDTASSIVIQRLYLSATGDLITKKGK